MEQRISRRRWMTVVPLAAVSAMAETAWAAGWKQVGDKDDVVVYEREIPGAELPLFRGETVVDADVLEVLAVIHDVPRQTQWCHNTVQSRLIARPKPDVQVIYQRIEAPMGMADRDVVMRSTFDIAADRRAAKMEFRDIDHGSAPDVEDVVRMPNLEGHFALRTAGRGRTKVVYRVHSDPGGRLPGWMAIRGIRKIPLETLIGLRRQVKATRGRYRRLVQAWSATSP